MAKTIFHVIRHFLKLEPANSQTTSAEREAVSRHAAGKHRLVEIGVFEGLTTAVIARAMAADGVLHAVDPFFPGRLGICWGRLIARRELRRAKPAGQVVFVPKLSFEALADVPGKVDFVFVDGDHSLEGIQRDWADWSAKIASGGIIALHDTRVPAHNPQVAELGSHKYFESHIRHDARFELVEQVDSLSILRRKNS